MTVQHDSLLKPMKCLSLKQPYADLLVTGIKTIELRKWKTKHRGTFLVHASKVAYDPNYDESRLGCIVGMAELTDVKYYETESDWKKDANKHLADDGFLSSNYGFIIQNPVYFRKPIPFSGSLNFFNVLFDKENMIAKQFIQEKIA